MQIWKWPLAISNEQTITMPQGAWILTVQAQEEQLMLWALCDEHAPVVQRLLAVYGTGNPVRIPSGGYVGSVQLRGEVLHVFDRGIVVN